MLRPRTCLAFRSGQPLGAGQELASTWIWPRYGGSRVSARRRIRVLNALDVVGAVRVIDDAAPGQHALGHIVGLAVQEGQHDFVIADEAGPELNGLTLRRAEDRIDEGFCRGLRQHAHTELSERSNKRRAVTPEV